MIPSLAPLESLSSPGLAVILAGGQSRRFGPNKADYRWKGRSFTAHIRQIARDAGLNVRVVRRDQVAPCGPLGGIYTAFHRHRAPWILFLACDMPLVRPSYLTRMMAVFHKTQPSPEALVTQIQAQAGFPIILTRSALPRIQAQIATGDVSLRTLFQSLRLKKLPPPPSELPRLININHRTDLSLLKSMDVGDGPCLSDTGRTGMVPA